MFYRHGRLRMYRKCQAVRVAGQDGLTIVVNGLVRISYRDPFGNHQQFFLGTGAPNEHADKLSGDISTARWWRGITVWAGL